MTKEEEIRIEEEAQEYINNDLTEKQMYRSILKVNAKERQA